MKWVNIKDLWYYIIMAVKSSFGRTKSTKMISG
jgi:hypothetical protein